MLKKIISGGQTGVDRIGLEVGKEFKYETGGTAPKGYKTEYGRDLDLKELGLVEHESDRYEPRTEENVKNSDGTVIFGNINSTGTKLTLSYLKQHKKPHIVNPRPQELYDFIIKEKIETLNVAGNRSSRLSKEELEAVIEILRNTFLKLKQKT